MSINLSHEKRRVLWLHRQMIKEYAESDIPCPLCSDSDLMRSFDKLVGEHRSEQKQALVRVYDI